MSDDAASAPATAADPKRLLPEQCARPNVVGRQVALSTGVTVTIVPAIATARQILQAIDRPDLLEYAIAAQRCRDQLVRVRRDPNVITDADWHGLMVLAVQSGHDVTEQEIVDNHWLDLSKDTLSIAQAAFGDGSVNPIRKRALALAAAGLADVPLTAMESAGMADWVWNDKRAPTIKEG